MLYKIFHLDEICITIAVMPEKIRRKKLYLLLVEDHPLTLLGIERFIQQANIPGFQEVSISTAASGHEALSSLTKKKFDLIILNIQLPDSDDYALARQCVQHDPHVRLVFFSAVFRSFSHSDLIKLGVRGYVHKGMPPHHLIEAILAVYYGGFYLPDSNLKLTPEPSRHHQEEEFESLVESLSFRESQVLNMLSSDRTKHDIARQLGISVRTVETYRTRLMKKLNCQSLVGLVRYALEHGFIDR